MSKRKTMAFENKCDELAPPRVFAKRVLISALFAGALTIVSLAIGAFGYHATAHLDWLDALLNAAMILTGMGPIAPLTTPQAKLFATFYALFSGVVYISSAALLIAPIAHRFLHRLHIDCD
jgi:hypothetical protein